MEPSTIKNTTLGEERQGNAETRIYKKILAINKILTSLSQLRFY